MRIWKILNQVSPHVCWGLLGPFIRCEGMKWIILRGNARFVGPKYMFHIGCESTYCVIWLVLRYRPCPWSSREYTCWAGILLSSSWSQLSRSKMMHTPWKYTHCQRAMPGLLVGSCSNNGVRECSHSGGTLGFSFSMLELVFFLV